MMTWQSVPSCLKVFPDAVLRQVCEPVGEFDTELRDLIEEMRILMRLLNGVGLAAPQVGIAKRLFVCEIEKRSLSLLNPSVTTVTGQAEMLEGCLSLPGVQVNVPRSERLCVSGYDCKGREKRFELRGLWARVVQHELDHLDGVLICDYGKKTSNTQNM